MAALTSDDVKRKARRLGADLVGICSAAAINANPPDPRWPQTPQRLWPQCRSVIAIAKRVPWGLFQAQDRLLRQAATHPVQDGLDPIALELCYYIEGRGFYAVTVPRTHTDLELRNASYGPLSLRHVAIEAGLGTLGLGLLLFAAICRQSESN